MRSATIFPQEWLQKTSSDSQVKPVEEGQLNRNFELSVEKIIMICFIPDTKQSYFQKTNRKWRSHFIFCEQNGSRFTAVFFWDRIYLWQYRSISCALAIYGSYITAKMDLLATPDFCHVKEKNYCCKLPPLILCSVLIIYYTSASTKPFYILCSTLWHKGTLCHNYHILQTSSSEHMESCVCR